MTREEWLYSDETIRRSQKSYAHFDLRTDIGQKREYITDPNAVASHGFYPFIHYTQRMVKYSKKKGRVPKERDICYAAHIDRCIFQYYSFILNECYNARVKQDGISSVAVAYRTDLHKSNMHFAKEAFDFIRSHPPCYVMIGDFTHFFDNLDHSYLKAQWCSLIGESRLPPDHFNVFKNVTSYSMWELSNLLELNKLEDSYNGRKQLNKRTRVLPKELFRKYRSNIIPNDKSYGIPQGSPISAILANIYMLEADKQINDLVTSLGGMYMRYSDDFMIVLPDAPNSDTRTQLLQIVNLFADIPNLTLEPNKTQYFYHNKGTVENIGQQFNASADTSKRSINFLGFTFDGQSVTVRAKTISKYYYRMYRKARFIVNSPKYSPDGRRVSKKSIYDRYSQKGADKGRGNFLTYIDHASAEFGPNEPIKRDTAHHMQKIRKALNKPIKNSTPNNSENSSSS